VEEASLKQIKTRLIVVVLAAFATLFLTGCVLRISAEDLYRLPQVSDDYLRLQAIINSVLAEGAEFSPPTGGPNRQSVQLKDLNGDGINEVIAFFSVPGESTLEIYIFEMVDGDYSIAEVIGGAGTAIESIRYVDMDGDGTMEIIVGWQLGDVLKYMEIYSIRDFHAVLLAAGEYEGITIFDLNSNGNDDVITVALPSQESSAVSTVFTLMSDGEMVTAQARLSSGIETITRVMRGRLIDGVPAIFIESEGRFEDGSFVTDICAFQNEEFTNISLRGFSGVSDETVRHRRILSSDINNDGIIKVPIPRRLRAQSETAYYAMDWYSFNAAGSSRLSLTTYHNHTDEWFLILPFDWRNRVTVRRDDVITGERTVIFSYVSNVTGEIDDFLKVYRITGDTREERARFPGRVRLISEGNAVYAFELLAPPDSFGLSFNEVLIRENFRLIYSDWLAGTL